MTIISKTDKIPTKKIVSVVGTITIRSLDMWSFSHWNEVKAMERMMKKAEKKGANAVLNFTYNKEGTHVFCSGLGVIVEDINKSTSPVENKSGVKFCEKCGSEMQESYKFCPFCGSELVF